MPVHIVSMLAQSIRLPSHSIQRAVSSIMSVLNVSSPPTKADVETDEELFAALKEYQHIAYSAHYERYQETQKDFMNIDDMQPYSVCYSENKGLRTLHFIVCWGSNGDDSDDPTQGILNKRIILLDMLNFGLSQDALIKMILKVIQDRDLVSAKKYAHYNIPVAIKVSEGFYQEGFFVQSKNAIIYDELIPKAEEKKSELLRTNTFFFREPLTRIPRKYLCDVTGKIMENPVYLDPRIDAEDSMRHLRLDQNSISRCVLNGVTPKNFFLDVELQKEIQIFKKMNPQLFPNDECLRNTHLHRHPSPVKANAHI